LFELFKKKKEKLKVQLPSFIAVHIPQNGCCITRQCLSFVYDISEQVADNG